MIERSTTFPPLRYFAQPGEPQRNSQSEKIIGWFNGRVVYWGRPVDELNNLVRDVTRIGRTVFRILVIIFAALGLGMGALRLRDLWLAGIHWQDLATAREPEFLGFWIAVVMIAYLVFSFSWERQRRTKIQHQPPAPAEYIEMDENRILGIPKKDWINVADVFHPDSAQLVQSAVYFASSCNHPLVEPLHLLAMSLREEAIQVLFARLGVNPKTIADKVKRSLASKGRPLKLNPPLSTEFQQLLLSAYEEAYRRRADQVEITDLFIALSKTGQQAQEILYDVGIEMDDLRNVATWLTLQNTLGRYYRRYRSRARFKPKNEMNRAMTAVMTPYLDRFSQDLTQLARAGYLEYCVGREQEIESVFRTVEAGNNGVVLVGQPGVGRKTIIKGLAQRMVTEDVPPIFQDKRLVSISLAALVAGATKPGELEERLMRIFAEVVKAGNIILCLFDIHNMIGITTERGEGLDLSEVFDEYLRKKAFIVIATSNAIEYRRYVENSALGETLFKIPVEEMDETQTIHVLEARVGAVEFQQKVYFSYKAIAAIVKHAKRYIHERFFPEKAIQLLEEVASYVRRTRGKKKVVIAEDVAQVVSALVKVPVTQVSERESEKLLHLEERLHQRLIGQDEAVKMVASALRRARAELRDAKRPIVNLLFLGPTGVGKTELAKTVAEAHFGSEKSMIRIDMSEYQESKSIDRLIGAPPGMTKGEEGGYLTEAVRRTPFALLLLDEIEKAHPDILNVFLQVMDDGRLTDSLGRTIDFTNVILIATSNAGTPLIQQRVREKTPAIQIRDELVNKELGKYFRPEFLNRFDGIMVFTPLSESELYQVAVLLLAEVQKRLIEKGITLRATPEAIQELVQEGYDPAFGARPLRRVIQNKVDNALANYLLQGKLTRRDVAVLEPGGTIRVEKAEQL